MEEFRKLARVQERPFASGLPVVGGLVAWVRTRWNNVAARWYVQSLFQQQNAFNADVVNHVERLNKRLRQQDEDLVQLTKTVAELETQVKHLSRRVVELESNRPK